MVKLAVLGMDPSFRNWGLAAGRYDTETNELTLSTCRVVQTEKTKDKRVRVNSDDIEAARQLWEGISPFLDEVSLIFVEVPHGSQSASAMKSYGICIGLLGVLAAMGKPFFELSAREVKISAVGDPEATKQQMIEWATRRFPGLPWPTKTVKGKTTVIASQCEHMADACAAIVAGLESHQFRQFAAMKL